MTTRMKSFLFGALFVLAVAGPLGRAVASTISGNITGVNYSAAPGETNNLGLTHDAGAGTYTWTDAGVATITDVGDCTVLGNQATCPAVPGSVQLFDGDDRADLSAGIFNGQYGFTASGGDGRDTVTTGAGNDSIFGGPGDDVMRGGGGADSLWGGSGIVDDTLETGSGNDVLEGGAGIDIFHPGDGDDVVSGGEGHDVTFGDRGNDTVSGGEGNDFLDVGFKEPAGADVLDGGPGDDTFNGVEARAGSPFAPLPNAIDTITCGTGDDFPEIGPQDIVGADCELVRQFFSCPASAGGPCDVSAFVSTAGPAGVAGAAAIGAAPRRGPVRLSGVKELTIKAGGSKSVALKLLKKKVNRVLRGRERVRVNGVAQRMVQRRTLASQKVPFKLRSGQ